MPKQPESTMQIDWRYHRPGRTNCGRLQEFLDEIASTIEGAAHTGLHGDGKICIVPVEHTAPISAGERGEKSI